MTGERFQAALNLLAEERRAVSDIRRQILADEALRLADPAHRSQLLTQTLHELSEIDDALGVMRSLNRGALLVQAHDAALGLTTTRVAGTV